MGATETWVVQGLQFQKENTCPLCGQNITGLELISAYRDFFDNSYQAFKEKLVALGRTIISEFSDKVTVAVQKTVGDNATLWEFWRQLGIGGGLSLPEIGTLASIIGELRDYAVALVEAKKATPLDAVHFLMSSYPREMLLRK